MLSCMHGDMILERRGQYGKRQCAKKTPNTRCNQMNETQTEKECERKREGMKERTKAYIHKLVVFTVRL